MSDNITLAKNYVAKRLNIWKSHSDLANGELARLRRSIGKKPGEVPQIWDVLFDDFPQELMSNNEEPTYAQWAVSIVLSLYALHQQGKDIKTNAMHVDGISHRLGRAVRELIEGESNEETIRNRFNVFATSSGISECAYHLRGIIQLLKAKDIPLDYISLTEDLYKFQFSDRADGVRLRWGQDFYRKTSKIDEGNNE